jgi:hypothetical protein
VQPVRLGLQPPRLQVTNPVSQGKPSRAEFGIHSLVVPGPSECCGGKEALQLFTGGLGHQVIRALVTLTAPHESTATLVTYLYATRLGRDTSLGRRHGRIGNTVNQSPSVWVPTYGPLCLFPWSYRHPVSREWVLKIQQGLRLPLPVGGSACGRRYWGLKETSNLVPLGTASDVAGAKW